MGKSNAGDHGNASKATESRQAGQVSSHAIEELMEFQPTVHQLYEQELFPELDFSRKQSDCDDEELEDVDAF